MEKALYIVQSHLIEGQSVSELAFIHGVDQTTVRRWIRRYQAGGSEALVRRSSRPKTSPNQTSYEVEEAIMLLRKQLTEEGLDAGAETISYHLAHQFEKIPSVTTIWRILHRRGFVTPQPAKRPRSSYKSFVADLPNEMWQSDMTHWKLGTGVKVEIVTFIDDCSRLVVSCDAVLVTKATHLPTMFHKAAEKWGYPASVLTDNGCIFTAKYRGGKVMLESELERLNIVFKHGKPYHPQTQGKVERFQQTLKQWLSKQVPARDLNQLQTQLDKFIDYYNRIRPHKSLGRRPPIDVWSERVKAQPGDEIASSQYRIRHDKVDKVGTLTIRYHSKLHHIGMGTKFKGRRIAMLIHDRDIRIVDPNTGELLRHLELDPSKDFQSRGIGRWP